MPVSQKKITRPLVSAWIGEGNYGDELMALCLRALLHEDFGVERLDYYHTGDFPLIPDSRMLVSSLCGPRNSVWKRLLRYIEMQRHQILLYGGGSIFHSENSIAWKHSLLRQYRHFQKDKPAGAVGVSVGPFSTKTAYEQCTKFFEELDFIICRDAESATIAKTMMPSDKVSLCGDMALLAPQFFKDKLPKAPQKDSNIVGISFVRLKNDQGTFTCMKHGDTFLNIVNSILKTGKRVRLFTLYNSTDMDDQSLNTWIQRNALLPDSVDIQTFSGDVFEIINKFNECSLIISMRLHGLITAYLLGIPCLSIAYNQKNHSFVNMAQGNNAYSLDWKSPHLAEQVAAALETSTYSTQAPHTPEQLGSEYIRKIFRNRLKSLNN